MTMLLRSFPTKCNLCFCIVRQSYGYKVPTRTLAATVGNTKKKYLHKEKTLKNIPVKQKLPVINIWDGMTVKDLANSLDKDTDHIFEVMIYIPQTDRYDRDKSVINDIEVIKEIIKKSGCKYIMKSKQKTRTQVDMDAYKRPQAHSSELVRRPPVVTIMGHVDHGKTTLLDKLRHSNIVDGEFGGITQHIGAFSVRLPTSKEEITFLDTPGHAAFSAIRARGAHATDIIVLVIAAEDGVMNQTKESIQLAKQANVPIIVAINKIDRSGVDVDLTKRGLFSEDVVLEEYGGEVQSVAISALKGTNLLELQEAIVAQAELLDLKADVTSLVEGVVIESKTDPGRGKLATALIKQGTLKRGAYLVAGTAFAKVRAMFNDQGQPVQLATPSQPVEILGWRELPSAGEEILQVETEKRMKEVISYREEIQKEEKMNKDIVEIKKFQEEHDRIYQEKLQTRLAAGYKRYKRGPREKDKVISGMYDGPQLCIVLKGDVDGSVEAILDTLETYNDHTQCRLDIIHYGVGQVSENDVTLADSFNGTVLAFNVAVVETVSKLARSKNVSIKTFNVIYRLTDYLRQELSNRLPPRIEHDVLGEANVLQVFQITEGKKKVPVAGCRCTSGSLHKKNLFKIVRENETIYEGNVLSMKHLKNEVQSIKTEVECGLSFEDRTIIPEPGDAIVCYQHKEVPQSINWDIGF